MKGEKMSELKTSELEDVLLKSDSSNLSKILKDIKETDFSTYMKNCFEKHGYQQQQVFINSDISLTYGYKLISLEKHTTQRDLIIRMCYAAHFTLEETQRALKLYGMSPLYVKVKRDALLMKGIQDRVGNILELNEYLIKNKEKPLRISGN